MIAQTQTTSFKLELYEGIHNLLTDNIYIALYDANAVLDSTTTVYTTTHEIVGLGYTAGGKLLTGVAISSTDYTAFASWANAVWAGARFTVRGALLYNASKANRAIAVLDFGSDKTVSNSTFTVTMPANTATTALIRSSN